MQITLEFKTKGEADIALAYLKAFAHIKPKIVDIKDEPEKRTMNNIKKIKGKGEYQNATEERKHCIRRHAGQDSF